MREDKIYNYEYVHILLRKHKGRAADHKCVDCPKQAAHWSLNHDAKDIRYQVGTNEEGRAYSLDFDSYSPRCRKCHYAYDKKHGLMRGPDGNRSGRTRTSLMEHPETCIIDGCDGKFYGRNLCQKHLARVQRRERGEVNDSPTPEQLAVQSVMDYVKNTCSVNEADYEKVLGSLIYTCRKARDELRAE